MTLTKSFSLSLLVHALLLAALIHWQIIATDPCKAGDAEKTVLASYLVTPSTPIKQMTATTPADKHAIALQHEKQPIEKQPDQPSSLQRAAIAGKQMSELTALIHSAIQEAQQYPASAQEMGRQGRSTISFLLHPDGTVTDLKLLHSSGTTSIDNAALAAVNNAAPFRQVNKYLHEAKPYQIDVVFLL